VFYSTRLAFLIMLLLAATMSCSKKPTAATDTATTAETPPAAPQAASPAIQAAAQPSGDVAAPNTKVVEAQTALKAKDYERAAAALSMDRRAPVAMTGEQLMAHNSAVADLYKQAAAAAAAGDPKAKAVLEKMKQDAMYHR
jgi:hypothetical protein